MDWQEKLKKAAEDYNALVFQEQEIERQLAQHREIRLQGFGKLQAMQEMFEEHLKDESLAVSKNGHGDPVVSQNRAARRRTAKSSGDSA